MKKDYIENLNFIQLKIVTYIEGTIMVLAGAGSGKTRVLTYRIAYLIEKGLTNILVLTFTKKAVNEIKFRIEKLGINSADHVWIGTFHSIFNLILRNEAQHLGFPYYYTIYNQESSKKIIKKLLKDLKLENIKYSINSILNYISRYKNALITGFYKDQKLTKDKNVYLHNNYEFIKKELNEIYYAYTERCFISKAMDFDDILLRSNELFIRYPNLLYKYQKLFKFILIDEYQDTNTAQYIIIKYLSSRSKNIFVVGDDAQSIYSFRGANIHNILNFKLYYPKAKIFLLEQNYRSTAYIVKAANSLIDFNKNQISKQIWTKNEKGNKIKIYKAISEREESEFVSNMILKIKKKYKLKNKDFAIFYRKNSQSRFFEDIFIKNNIPYQIKGSISFYQRKDIKDLIASLKLLINHYDSETFFRIVNSPPRVIVKKTINKLLEIASKYKMNPVYIIDNISFYNYYIYINAIIKHILKKLLINLIQFYKRLTEEAYILVQEIFLNFGFIKKKHVLNKDKNITDFLNSIKYYVKEQTIFNNGSTSLLSFLASFLLDIKECESNKLDTVSLLTIHLSKGLEFPVVFIVGLEENLFPSILSLKKQLNLEEERRLLYVALTRAKQQLIISYSLKRYLFGKWIDSKPSIFFKEIEKKYIEILNTNL